MTLKQIKEILETYSEDKLEDIAVYHDPKTDVTIPIVLYNCRFFPKGRN